MPEVFVIVAVVMMVGGSWISYVWGLKTVQRLNKGQPSQVLRALLAMCIYITLLPGITFGGGNYWLATMITIPFTIIMAIWLAKIASLVSKRRSLAMAAETEQIDPDTVNVRTVPAFSETGGTGRSARAQRVMRGA